MLIWSDGDGGEARPAKEKQMKTDERRRKVGGKGEKI